MSYFEIDDVQATAETTPQREKLPDGEYLVVISEADAGFQTQKSQEPGLKLVYNVQTGANEGKAIEEVLFYKNIDVVKSKVAQLAVATGFSGKFSAADVPKLEGKRMIIILKTNDKGYQNVVKYISSTGGAPTPQAAASAGTPPWARK